MFWDRLNYRDVIKDRLKENEKERGYQSRLAEAAGCQTSQFSRIVTGQLNLTPDQGMALCDFWEMDGLRQDYFLELIAFERASSPSLRSKLAKKLAEMRQVGREADKLAPYKKEDLLHLDYLKSCFLFGDWHRSAILESLRIKHCRTVEAIAEKFMLARETVQKDLNEMERFGLVARSGDEWSYHESDIAMLADDNHATQFIMKSYNALARAKANDAFSRKQAGDFFVSNIGAISMRDFIDLKKMLTDIVKDHIRMMKSSHPEELISLNIDLFKI